MGQSHRALLRALRDTSGGQPKFDFQFDPTTTTTDDGARRVAEQHVGVGTFDLCAACNISTGTGTANLLLEPAGHLLTRHELLIATFSQDWTLPLDKGAHTLSVPYRLRTDCVDKRRCLGKL